MYDGGFDGSSVSSRETAPDNLSYEICRRLNMATLAIESPKTYKTILKNKVKLFHGTNSNALENILKHGVCSEAEALERGIPVLSGEVANTSRKYISFTDSLNHAVGYSTLKPSVNAPKDTSFSVVIGISTEALDSPEVLSSRLHTSVPEIGIRNHLSTKHIKLTMNKLTEDDINELYLESLTKTTYDKIMTQYISDGYSCK